jgi:hypothetical protein
MQSVDSLEIVVVSQLLARHNATRACEESHARFPTDSPFDHLAIGFTRVVHKSSNRAASGVNDHFVVEAHKIIALMCVSRFLDPECE